EVGVAVAREAIVGPAAIDLHDVTDAAGGRGGAGGQVHRDARGGGGDGAGDVVCVLQAIGARAAVDGAGHTRIGIEHEDIVIGAAEQVLDVTEGDTVQAPGSETGEIPGVDEVVPLDRVRAGPAVDDGGRGRALAVQVEGIIAAAAHHRVVAALAIEVVIVGVADEAVVGDGARDLRDVADAPGGGGRAGGQVDRDTRRAPRHE